jgi:hypothetical protein
VFAIVCPNCGVDTYLSLDNVVYEGPFRCWKCRGTFVVKIEDEELKYCKPISEEAFEKMREIEL